MAQAVEQIIIDRPVGTVWAMHTQPSIIPRISVNTVKYQPRGPMRVGTRIDGATKVVGRTVEWEAEVVEFVELRGYRLKSVRAPLQWELSYSYHPHGQGTVVIAEQTAFGLDGFFGRLSERFIVSRYRRDLSRNLANLKEIVESQPLVNGW